MDRGRRRGLIFGLAVVVAATAVLMLAPSLRTEIAVRTELRAEDWLGASPIGFKADFSDELAGNDEAARRVAVALASAVRRRTGTS